VKRALAVLTAAAFLTLVVGVVAAGGELVALVPATLFAVLGTLGFDWIDRRHQRAWSAAYIVVQLAIGYVTFIASGAAIGAVLLLIVLVCQSVLLLPLPWVAVVVALIPLAHLGMEWRTGIREGLGTLAAAVFAAVLTTLLVREQQARAQLQKYAAQAERLAATQERNRVARDIHDGLGHALTVVQMQVKAARAVLEVDAARADAVLAKAQAQAEEALAEVRRSVSALREPRVVPLPDALRGLVDEMSAAGVPTRLEVSGSPRRLPAETEETLYRAAQEGLTNVRKHALATKAELSLEYTEKVRLEIRDDGTGIDPNDNTGGYGLLGVRERAANVGGLMSVESAPGQGATLRVEVPG
jgi:signal transduction histidine kinase